MIQEPSFEQRERDGRLAWMVVGACAVLTLALLVGLFFALRGFVVQHAEQSWQRQMEEARERNRILAEQAERSVESDTAVDVASAPPPPNSTQPIGDPASWVGADDYPVYALRNGDEGRARVTVSVGADGRPLGCAVAETSGHWSLDNATCAAMLNHGRFTAAPGIRTRRYWTSPPIRWRIPA